MQIDLIWTPWFQDTSYFLKPFLKGTILRSGDWERGKFDFDHYFAFSVIGLLYFPTINALFVTYYICRGVVNNIADVVEKGGKTKKMKKWQGLKVAEEYMLTHFKVDAGNERYKISKKPSSLCHLHSWSPIHQSTPADKNNQYSDGMPGWTGILLKCKQG